MFYKALLRPILFRLDPERAHHVGLWFLKLASALPPLRWLLALCYRRRRASLRQTIWGLDFPAPIGLAAGFDKNACAVPALASLGFGFVEIGAVSAEGRPGNPKKRIFRLKDDQGIINRMGLPNDGAEVIGRRLAGLPAQPVPVFANIVKTSDLEGDTATMAADYVKTMRAILPHVDGVTVNVSCPATPELRTLGRQEAMFELLEALSATREEVAPGTGKPILLKVSPDIDDEERDVIVAACEKGLLDGLVLTNTTTTRPDDLRAPSTVTAERGGLSGRPLFPRALEHVRWFAETTGGKVPIVGVGGIFGPDDARAMLDAGAWLVEVYTGFVYEGPSLPRRIVEALDGNAWKPRAPSAV